LEKGKRNASKRKPQHPSTKSKLRIHDSSSFSSTMDLNTSITNIPRKHILQTLNTRTPFLQEVSIFLVSSFLNQQARSKKSYYSSTLHKAAQKEYSLFSPFPELIL